MARVALRIAQVAFLALVLPYLAGLLRSGLPDWVIGAGLVIAGVGGVAAVVLGIRSLRRLASDRRSALWAIWIGGISAAFPVIALVAILIYLPALF